MGFERMNISKNMPSLPSMSKGVPSMFKGKGSSKAEQNPAETSPKATPKNPASAEVSPKVKAKSANLSPWLT